MSRSVTRGLKKYEWTDKPMSKIHFLNDSRSQQMYNLPDISSILNFSFLTED